MLPGEELPLRIFEPRYSALVGRLPRDGRPGVRRRADRGGPRGRRRGQPAATSARWRTSPRSPISATAATGCNCVMAERIRVLEWQPDDPYPRAAVEVWPDEPGERSPLTRSGTSRTAWSRCSSGSPAPGAPMSTRRDIVAGADAARRRRQCGCTRWRPVSRWGRPTGTRCWPRRRSRHAAGGAARRRGDRQRDGRVPAVGRLA